MYFQRQNKPVCWPDPSSFVNLVWSGLVWSGLVWSGSLPRPSSLAFTPGDHPWRSPLAISHPWRSATPGDHPWPSSLAITPAHHLCQSPLAIINGHHLWPSSLAFTPARGPSCDPTSRQAGDGQAFGSSVLSL